MNGDIKENVTRRSIWLRFCFMIIMSMAFGVAEVIVTAIVAVQFCSSLFTGQTNDHLIRFGRNLARYLQQITAYLTFTTEDVPYPFMDWPNEPRDELDTEETSIEVEEPPEEAEDEIEDVEAAEETDEANEVKETEVASEDSDVRPEELTETANEEPHVDQVSEAGIDDAAKEEDLPPRENQPVPASDEAQEDRASETIPAKVAQTAIFADSNAYEKFMGERSRLGGEKFVEILDLAPRLSWLDVGCGTGALSGVVLDKCDPAALIGVDRSDEQISLAQTNLGRPQASFRAGDATKLPFEADSFDVAVSSYVLNFVPEKQRMMDEMARVVRPEGIVAISVFDHAGGRMSAHPFWELIGTKDPEFRNAEFEKRGWNVTQPEDLAILFENAGLERVTVDSIEIDDTFRDFDEYWTSMTSLPSSGMSLYIDDLNDADRNVFRAELKAIIPVKSDGSIELKSGSWVARGNVPA